MATAPAYAATPRYAVGNLTTGVTTLTVTGVTGLTSIIAAGANGTRINRVRIKATASNAASLVSLWIYSGSGNAQLFDQFVTTSTTPSSTVASYQADKTYTDFVLPTGYTLYASAYTTENWNVECFAADL